MNKPSHFLRPDNFCLFKKEYSVLDFNSAKEWYKDKLKGKPVLDTLNTRRARFWIRNLKLYPRNKYEDILILNVCILHLRRQGAAVSQPGAVTERHEGVASAHGDNSSSARRIRQVFLQCFDQLWLSKK